MKRYADGGVTEGPNEDIGDDVRARALAWVKRQQEGGSEPAPAEAKPKAAPKRAVAPKRAEAPAKPAPKQSYDARGIPVGEPGDVVDTNPKPMADDRRMMSPDTVRNLKNLATAAGMIPGAGPIAARSAAMAMRPGAVKTVSEVPKAAEKVAKAAKTAKAAPKRAPAEPSKARARTRYNEDEVGVEFSKGGKVRGWGAARGGKTFKVY